jgi:hypothetical protein
MDAEKIINLTSDAVRRMLDLLNVAALPKHQPGQRREERLPMAGTVEVWLPDDCYGDRRLLATLHDLSPHGLAMRARRPVPTDTRIALAIHEARVSLYGRGVVRHCTRAQIGYLVGVEFLFGDAASADAAPPDAALD